jgi:adenosylcobyric acid synthase
MGKGVTEAAPFCRLEDGGTGGAVSGMVFGSYLHGLFDSGELTLRLAELLAERKGIELPKVKIESRKSYRERQYALLAAEVRQSLDMGRIYGIMEEYE